MRSRVVEGAGARFTLAPPHISKTSGPLLWRHPVQRRGSDNQAHAAIQDAVTHQMNLTFVGGWAKQAQRLAAEDTGHQLQLGGARGTRSI